MSVLKKNGIVVRTLFLVMAVLAPGMAMASEPAETVSCSYEIKKPCTSGTATVEFKNGSIEKLSFDNFFCGLPGQPGYSCLVESARTGSDKWQQSDGKTTIGFADSFNPDAPDYASISVSKDSVVLDLSNTQSGGKCGAGAELPKSVTLPRKSKKCKVRL